MSGTVRPVVDRVRTHRDGTVSIHTHDLGVLSGLVHADVPDMLRTIGEVRRQGPCLKCGHLACPCCGNWCDRLDASAGETVFDRVCCGGVCTYAAGECLRCGYVVCTCERQNPGIVVLPKRHAVPAPIGICALLPLCLGEALMVPGERRHLRTQSQIRMRPPYSLIATLRAEDGRLLGGRVQFLEIAGALACANIAECGNETPDFDLPDGRKEAITLDGRIIDPSHVVELAFLNNTDSVGTLCATLYGSQIL